MRIMKWSETRVLVTGAAGFIGVNLLKKLTNLNAEVLAFDNFSTGKRNSLGFFDVQIIDGDVTDSNLSEKIKGGIDFIFHFGAPSSVILFNDAPVKCYNETCGGLLNVIKLAIEKNAIRVIYASSGSVYGNIPPPQSETTVPTPVNLYGLSKLMCERIALFFSKVDSVGLRIFAGYGPHEDHKGVISSPVTIFLESIMTGVQPNVYGDGRQCRDFVYADDIVEAIIRSAMYKEENKRSSILNVGSGHSYSFNYTIELLNDYLGTNIKPAFVPKPFNYLEYTQADTTLLNEKLAIAPLTLEEGLKRYLKTLNMI